MIPQKHLFVVRAWLLLTAKEKSSQKVRSPNVVLESNSLEISTHSYMMSHKKKNTDLDSSTSLSYTPFIQAIIE